MIELASAAYGVSMFAVFLRKSLDVQHVACAVGFAFYALINLTCLLFCPLSQWHLEGIHFHLPAAIVVANAMLVVMLSKIMYDKIK